MFEDLHKKLKDSVPQVLICKEKEKTEMTMGHSFIFEVFTEDDTEITFDKLAQKARKVNAEDCNTKVQLCKGWIVRRRCRE
jgi:hypothetical protein